MGRDTTIIKPISVPTSALPSRGPIYYKIKAGDTLEGIAKTLDVPIRQITWSNPGLRVPLKHGKVLRISPVPGLVLAVKSGDSIQTVATAYGADPGNIVHFTRIPDPRTPRPMLLMPLAASL